MFSTVPKTPSHFPSHKMSTFITLGHLPSPKRVQIYRSVVSSIFILNREDCGFSPEVGRDQDKGIRMNSKPKARSVQSGLDEPMSPPT